MEKLWIVIALCLAVALIWYFNRKIVRQVFMDTLTMNGKFSRKSLQMFASFVIATVMGFIIIYRNQVNDSAIEVFYGFLMLAGGMAILTVWDKLRGKGNTTDQGNSN